MNYCIKFKDETNTTYGVVIDKRPDIPAPIRRYEAIEVPGRDGMLYTDKDTYEDIKITIQMHFISRDPNRWAHDYRKVKQWLQGTGRLEFNDDPGYFYKVKKIEIGSAERKIRRAGKFEVTFTCDPYLYLQDGLKEQELGNKLYNADDMCRPIYRIVGEGNCYLSVNNKLLIINVGQEVYLDTDKMLCYRKNGDIQNIALTGDYKDAFLNQGENIFSFSDFSIYITPNWRCL